MSDEMPDFLWIDESNAGFIKEDVFEGEGVKYIREDLTPKPVDVENFKRAWMYCYELSNGLSDVLEEAVGVIDEYLPNTQQIREIKAKEQTLLNDLNDKDYSKEKGLIGGLPHIEGLDGAINHAQNAPDHTDQYFKKVHAQAIDQLLEAAQAYAKLMEGKT